MTRTSTYSLIGALLFLAATSVSAQSPPTPIEVTLLGTGRPDPTMDRFGPATLVRAGGATLLFDAGRGVSQRLWQLKIPLGDVDALFLTHLHSDHTVGIPDLWLTGWLPAPFGGRREPLKVWGPEGTKDMMTAMRRAFQWDIRVRGESQPLPPAGIEVDAHDISEGVVYDRDGVKVTAFLVDHGGALEPAFGYRVDHAGRSVVISGDTRPNDNLVRHAANVDLLVHEVAAVRPELLTSSPTAATARAILGFHTSPEDAGRVFGRARPRLAVFSHVVLLTTDPRIPPPTGADILGRARSSYNGRVVLGEDLMSIDIGDTVAVHRFGQGASDRPTSPSSSSPPARASGGAEASQRAKALLLDPANPEWTRASPPVWYARFETSKGDFVVRCVRAHGPNGSDRFYNLIRLGYYNDVRFHRVIPSYIAQWGLSGDPAVNAAWLHAQFEDDPKYGSNVRGSLAFARDTVPGTSNTQVYVNLKDNTRNDTNPFAIFGRVVRGMDVLDSLYSGYGDRSGSGVRQHRQGKIVSGGNAYLDSEFPRLDHLIRAEIIDGPAGE